MQVQRSAVLHASGGDGGRCEKARSADRSVDIDGKIASGDNLE